MLIGASAEGDERPGVFSTTVDRILALVDLPTVVMHLPSDVGPDVGVPTNMLVPVVASRGSRAAEELAYSIAHSTGGRASALHVVNRPQAQAVMFSRATESEAVRSGKEILAGSAAFGEKLGIAVATHIRLAGNAEEEIVELANEEGFDLLVIGASNRPLTHRPFFGHRVNYVLDHAEVPVAIVALHTQIDRST